MNYNFLAARFDKLEILEFVFRETDLQVYDLGSDAGQEIYEYKTTAEIESKFDLDNGDTFAVTFQLWSPPHGGKPVFRKIALDPKHCKGHTFRYATDAPGLIQLYFGGLRNNELYQSHIGHLSEKAADDWRDINLIDPPEGTWNWKTIQSTSGKLKYHIHNKLAIRKIGSAGVLPGADKLEKQGTRFR